MAALIPGVFSFLNVQATIVGPGIAIPLGAGAGDAEEGITIEMEEDADELTVGADGTPMHALNPSKVGRITVRLMKTSPTNGLLGAAYNFQRSLSSNWGQNIISLVDTVRGDVYTCQSVAFRRFPKNDYAKKAGMIEWVFNAGIIDPSLAAA